jgi:hypothetical protein
MAFDTDNNIAVQGFSGEAIVATDYVATEGNHFQVVKLAYGTPGVTGSANRVTSSSPLPVNVLNNPTVSVSSIGSTVTVAGTVSVTQPVGVTATDLDIRNLTAGSVTAGSPSTSTVDIVRVIGYSGGWPVGVTATDLDIRNLSAGSVTAGDPSLTGGSIDIVRVVGYSGGWPIAVTGTSFDIRGLSGTRDSVSVTNEVSVNDGSSGPYHTNVTLDGGFQIRSLKATRGAEKQSSAASLLSMLISEPDGTLEDTVRVVGLSGAWPVNTFLHGLTNINNYDTKLPLLVDSTGALAVYLAAGSISVTADVGGLGLTLNIGSTITIAGVCASNATQASQVLQVHGYTGTGFIPITVTASDLDIRGLSSSTDSVAVTGSVSVSNQPAFSFDGNSQLKVVEGSASSLATSMSSLSTSVSTLSTAFGSAASSSLTSTTNGIKMLKVDVQNIAQPTGGTYGSINVTSAVALGNQALQSGVHLKSASGNQGIIRVGFNNQVATVGFPLDAGDQLFIETNNTSNIFVAANTGCTLSYIGT